MSRLNGLPGYDAWLTREPLLDFPENNDRGLWCDGCFSFGELAPVAVELRCEGDVERLCQRCLDQLRDRYLDHNPDREFPTARND